MRPPTVPDQIVLAVGGSVAPADIQGICDRLQELLGDSGGNLVVCDVSALVDPDLVAVDALARLQLTANRSQCQVRLVHVCGRLQELLTLTGLSEVLPLTDSGLSARGGRAGRTARTASQYRGRS